MQINPNGDITASGFSSSSGQLTPTNTTLIAPKMDNTGQFSVDDKLMALACVVGELVHAATGKAARVKVTNDAGDFVWMDLPARSTDAAVEWITSAAAR